MKICKVCNIEKVESEFYQRRGKPSGRCKSCHKEYRDKHYKDNKGMYLEKARRNEAIYRERNKVFILAFFKDHPCVDCGETDMRCLQFDHNKPELKSFNISEALQKGVSMAALEAEVAKCTVRCANCHAKKTAEQFQYHMYKGIYY